MSGNVKKTKDVPSQKPKPEKKEKKEKPAKDAKTKKVGASDNADHLFFHYIPRKVEETRVPFIRP
jgi:hypothetical protein